MCLSVKLWIFPPFLATASFTLNPLICFLLVPGLLSTRTSTPIDPWSHEGEKPETLTHLFLYPGTIAGWRHGQLDEAGAQEDQQQDGRDVLPHVVVEAVRSKAQHVLQVFKESERVVKTKQQGVRSVVCGKEFTIVYMFLLYKPDGLYTFFSVLSFWLHSNNLLVYSICSLFLIPLIIDYIVAIYVCIWQTKVLCRPS